MKNKKIVISGVNIIEGGTLTIFRDCLDEAVRYFGPEYQIIALVNNEKLFNIPGVTYIENPSVKRSWIRRLWFEYVECYRLSAELGVGCWVSIHDITPRVLAERKIVYCHNPSPFYRASLKEAWFDPKFFLFTKLYKYLYSILIRSNYAVVVQQNWIKNSFEEMYGHEKVIVAHPAINEKAENKKKLTCSKGKKILLYPALPRVFKNFEVLYKAILLLPDDVRRNIDIRLTLNGDENRYSRYLKLKFKAMPEVNFIGRQSSGMMMAQYDECDAVLFPSKLETWGLPITEAIKFDKPLLVSNLEYAYETVGVYKKACFLGHDKPKEWADAIASLVRGDLMFSAGNDPSRLRCDTSDWNEFWAVITEGLK